MSMQDPNRPARPRPGQGAPSGRPATPVVAIVIAAIAGLVGLVILRDVKSEKGTAGPSATVEVTDTTEPLATDDTTVDTSNAPVLTRTGATVVVANASGKKGAAGALTDELKARGYDTGKAFTANSGVLNDLTQILATPGDAAALEVAKSVMAEMGLGGTPGVLDESAPVKQSDVGSATVVILLGLDKAGQSLLPLSGAEAASATTEVPIMAGTEPPTTG